MAILYCNLQVYLSGIGDTILTLKANAKEILTPNMYKIVTLKANAKEIVTLKCV